MGTEIVGFLVSTVRYERFSVDDVKILKLTVSRHLDLPCLLSDLVCGMRPIPVIGVKKGDVSGFGVL